MWGRVDSGKRLRGKGLSSDSSGSLGRASQDNRCQCRAKAAESVPGAGFSILSQALNRGQFGHREEIRGQVKSELHAAPAMPTIHRTLPTRCARVRKELRPMALSPQGFPLGSACSRVHEGICHPGFHL